MPRNLELRTRQKKGQKTLEDEKSNVIPELLAWLREYGLTLSVGEDARGQKILNVRPDRLITEDIRNSIKDYRDELIAEILCPSVDASVSLDIVTGAKDARKAEESAAKREREKGMLFKPAA